VQNVVVYNEGRTETKYMRTKCFGRIFGPKRDEMTHRNGELYKVWFHSSYCLTRIVTLFKSRIV